MHGQIDGRDRTYEQKNQPISEHKKNYHMRQRKQSIEEETESHTLTTILSYSTRSSSVPISFTTGRIDNDLYPRLTCAIIDIDKHRVLLGTNSLDPAMHANGSADSGPCYLLACLQMICGNQSNFLPTFSQNHSLTPPHPCLTPPLPHLFFQKRGEKT
jgi:hypothetical protein